MLTRNEIREALKDNVVEVNGPLHSPCWLLVFNVGQPQLLVKGVWGCDNGPMPAGMEVRQHCENELCCNPSHLYLAKKEMIQADAAE